MFGDAITAGYWPEESGGVRSYYLYDGDLLTAEMDATGTLTSIHFWGADGLVSREECRDRLCIIETCDIFIPGGWRLDRVQRKYITCPRVSTGPSTLAKGIDYRETVEVITA